MPVLAYVVISTFLISLGGLVGVFSLAAKKETLNKIVLFLVGLSAGTLMGGAFLHLIPESLEKLPIDKVFYILLISFVTFYFIEKILYWRHCHDENCNIHSFGYINLIGDSVHNFIDGLVIAATFLIDINLGIATAIAIGLHEIPQEVGDFGVLIHAGYQRKKALILNFAVALTVVLGGIAGYFLSPFVENMTTYLLPFAAGGFIYISTSDLIPEIRKETGIKKSIISFSFFILGIAIMYLAKTIK